MFYSSMYFLQRKGGNNTKTIVTYEGQWENQS